MKIIIVIPCYNEEKILEENVIKILSAVKSLPADVRIVISDNNSTDATGEIGEKLAKEYEEVDYVFVARRGKGAAALEAWKKYDADLYGFMDADLATDLGALPRALNFFNEGYDLVVGSRRVPGAKVKRQKHRKFISAVLSFLIRNLLKTKIKDTPCGFKFMNKKVMTEVVPFVEDRKWVFDTELLILAERAGFKIKEMPVCWVEQSRGGSRVNVYKTIKEYLKSIWKIRKRLAANNQ